MPSVVRARYEGVVLRLLGRLELREGKEVVLEVYEDMSCLPGRSAAW
ncbi:antitoxin AF2212-like protein [Hyperthermus butylicus]|nr:antitoxin AF2212-like protein [Hyperthermus butylicus]